MIPNKMKWMIINLFAQLFLLTKIRLTGRNGRPEKNERRIDENVEQTLSLNELTTYRLNGLHHVLDQTFI